MKVLFIESAGLYSAGAFRCLVPLIIELRKFNVEGYVALPITADAVKLLDDAGIPYLQMQSCAYTRMIAKNASLMERLKMPAKDIVVKYSARKLANYIKENDINIVHTNVSVSCMGYYTAKAARVPHIWHIREFVEEGYNCQFFKKNQIYGFMNSKYTNAIITISKALSNKYGCMVDGRKIFLVYDGIEVEEFYAPNKAILRTDSISLLCAGRICEQKGQAELIKAIGLLKYKYGWKLNVLFAGTDSNNMIEIYTKLAKENNVSDQVKFLGHVSDMDKLYRKADIFCMCSKNEAFGRVTVEAMLSGCLVIGSKSGGTPEILEDGTYGLLYEQGNVEDLADKIAYAVENRAEMRKIASMGREHAYRTFDAKNNAEKIFQLYQTVI